MNIDTPKTNAQTIELKWTQRGYTVSRPSIEEASLVPANFAQTLERENARLRDEYKNLLGQVVQARDGFGIYRNSPSMAKAIEDGETFFFGANDKLRDEPERKIQPPNPYENRKHDGP